MIITGLLNLQMMIESILYYMRVDVHWTYPYHIDPTLSKPVVYENTG